MDKLQQQLRHDAELINVEVTTELDNRIRASLEGITPEHPQPEPPRQRPRSMWLASSLTGVAAAAAVILIVNLNQPEPVEPALPTQIVSLPALTPNLNFQPAVMTAPLQKELEDLEADLKKAEEAVRKDIGIFP